MIDGDDRRTAATRRATTRRKEEGGGAGADAAGDEAIESCSGVCLRRAIFFIFLTREITVLVAGVGIAGGAHAKKRCGRLIPEQQCREIGHDHDVGENVF